MPWATQDATCATMHRLIPLPPLEGTLNMIIQRFSKNKIGMWYLPQRIQICWGILGTQSKGTSSNFKKLARFLVNFKHNISNDFEYHSYYASGIGQVI